jgi:hypothetical protein
MLTIKNYLSLTVNIQKEKMMDKQEWLLTLRQLAVVWSVSLCNCNSHRGSAYLDICLNFP